MTLSEEAAALDSVRVARAYVSALRIDSRSRRTALQKATRVAKDVFLDDRFSNKVKEELGRLFEDSSDNYLKTTDIIGAHEARRFARLKRRAAVVFIVLLYVAAFVALFITRDVRILAAVVVVFPLERILLKDPFALALVSKCAALCARMRLH